MMNIGKGDVLIIEGKKHEVIGIRECVDKWDSKTKRLVGEHYFIELHELGNNSLSPTHVAKRYLDNPNEIVLFNTNSEAEPSVSERLEDGKANNGKIIKVQDIELE